ncbi:hypothetical protein PG990_000211 [Apiospora arundinis]
MEGLDATSMLPSTIQLKDMKFSGGYQCLVLSSDSAAEIFPNRVQEGSIAEHGGSFGINVEDGGSAPPPVP